MFSYYSYGSDVCTHTEGIFSLHAPPGAIVIYSRVCVLSVCLTKFQWTVTKFQWTKRTSNNKKYQ